VPLWGFRCRFFAAARPSAGRRIVRPRLRLAMILAIRGPSWSPYWSQNLRRSAPARIQRKRASRTSDYVLLLLALRSPHRSSSHRKTEVKAKLLQEGVETGSSCFYTFQCLDATQDLFETRVLTQRFEIRISFEVTLIAVAQANGDLYQVQGSIEFANLGVQAS
jgi:hypothetical protein